MCIKNLRELRLPVVRVDQDDSEASIVVVFAPWEIYRFIIDSYDCEVVSISSCRRRLNNT